MHERSHNDSAVGEYIESGSLFDILALPNQLQRVQISMSILVQVVAKGHSAFLVGYVLGTCGCYQAGT